MEKKNTGLVVCLVIIILGLVGFITYDKVLKDKYFNKNESEKTIENNTEVDINENSSNEKNKEKTVDDLYQEYINNLEKELKNSLDGYDLIKEIGTTQDDDDYSFNLNNKEQLTLISNEDEYVISNNVISMYLISMGQAGNSELFFIKNDGNLYKVDPSSIIIDGEEPNIKKVNLKNIISIQQTSYNNEYTAADGALFIDIEGNVYTKE